MLRLVYQACVLGHPKGIKDGSRILPHLRSKILVLWLENRAVVDVRWTGMRPLAFGPHEDCTERRKDTLRLC